ncbi:MAG TPA: ABC transporter ATP-binding protein [Streptosporangiaceae bacterium]|nr:ABC transporter ATP-binding protein [Streptosporangiaceae bacterium]
MAAADDLPGRLLPLAGGRAAPLVSARGVSKHFGAGWRLPWRPATRVRAVDGVDLEVRAGETVGLIGESGSGKSTLGRLLLRVQDVTSGSIWFDGTDITGAHGAQLRAARRRMNLVFQNPYSAVDRRWRIRDVIAEPLAAHGIGDPASRQERVSELIQLVGLPGTFEARYPHQLSGGQLQRVVVARALATGPDFIVADEPTASLDVSVRAQLINLMADLKRQFGLAMLFISHDLRTVSALSDRIAVMYLGRLVETGPAAALTTVPQHPYTQALIAALPRLAPGQRRIVAPQGEIPSAVNPPSGCHYHPRCPLARPICRTEYPVLEEKQPGVWVACHAVAGNPPGITV